LPALAGNGINLFRDKTLRSLTQLNFNLAMSNNLLMAKSSPALLILQIHCLEETKITLRGARFDSDQCPTGHGEIKQLAEECGALVVPAATFCQG